VACQRLEEIASRFESEILTAMASQARGLVALAVGDPATALGLLRTAFSVWREVGAPYIEARLRLLAGLACRALGDEEGARLDLEAAKAVFENLGAAPDQARAEELLSRPIRRSRNILTSREIEVLTRIAAGRTNRIIAAELGLSEKTVDRHVSNIFDKLAVSSRAAATAVALQGGLLRLAHG
jgi:DNA-binding NarL/FixJ family response regulator